MAQSSADGPRSPTMPGCTIRHTCGATPPRGWRASGRARRSAAGRNSATASIVTASAMSNSTETSWPRAAQLDVQPLRQAVEAARQEQDAHARPGSPRSADARQLVAGQPVDDAPAAEAGAHLHEVVRVGHHLADQRRLRPSGWARMAASSRSACSGGTIATSLPSLATYSGSRPRNSQAASTCALHRDGGFVDEHADAGLRGDLVQRRRQPAARRVAQHAQLGHGRRPSPPPGRAARRCPTAGRCRRPATRAATSPPCRGRRSCRRRRMRSPGPRAVARDVDARRHHADAGGGDEDAVALALLDHLGVAGDDRHAGLARGARPSTRRCASGRPARSLLRG